MKASLSRRAFSACLRSLMSRTMLWKYFLPLMSITRALTSTGNMAPSFF